LLERQEALTSGSVEIRFLGTLTVRCGDVRGFFLLGLTLENSESGVKAFSSENNVSEAHNNFPTEDVVGHRSLHVFLDLALQPSRCLTHFLEKVISSNQASTCRTSSQMYRWHCMGCRFWRKSTPNLL